MPAKSYQFMIYNLKGKTRDPGRIITVGNIIPVSFKDSLKGDWLWMGDTCHVQMLQDVRRKITTAMSDRCQVQ